MPTLIQRSTMHPIIRNATENDRRALQRLAELDSQRPLSMPALIAENRGLPAAAISLADGRIVADPFEHTAVLRQLLRYRYGAGQAYSRQPSLSERMRERVSIRPVARASEG
jgi:hypothetical protein